MQFSLPYLYEALAIALALSLDSFACGLAYGASQIKVPLRSALIVAIICSLTLGFTLLLGSAVAPYISQTAVQYISFAILLTMMLLKLFDVRFILKVFEDEQAADNNKDKLLSKKEAISLALALSLDSLGVGFSAGMSGTNTVYLIIFSLLIGASALLIGQRTGTAAAHKVKDGLCWVSGIILLALAISKLL